MRGRRPSEAKEQFWRGHLRRQASGRLSIRDYCAQHDLSEPSFYAWRREIARRDRVRSRANSEPSLRDGAVIRDTGCTVTPGFVRLQVQPPAASGSAAPIEIVLPDGWRVLTPPGATRDQLCVVLTALQAAAALGAQPC
jgi:hypothetical protein